MEHICYDCYTYYSPPLENRMSISKNTSKNQFSLQLSSVTAEDTGVYYCATYTVSQIHCEPRLELFCKGPQEPGKGGSFRSQHAQTQPQCQVQTHT
jgi:hypothetical protein